MEQAGKWIFVAGLVLAAIGLLVWLAGDKLSWFGRLPGDIRIERDNFRFYAPIVSMLLISIVLSVLFRLVSWVWERFFK